MTTTPARHDGIVGRARRIIWPGRKRWGLRTLGFLVLGMVALGVSMAQGYHTLGTASCTVIAVLGAGYCSVRGVIAMQNLELVRRR